MSSLYDLDFYEWTRQQAAALRERRLSEADLENLAEEIESMGKTDKRKMESALTGMLVHLLKWDYQPSRGSASWEISIRKQQRRLLKILKDSPSLKRALEDSFAECYDDARKDAATETGLPISTFPADPPYDVNYVLQKGVTLEGGQNPDDGAAPDDDMR